jgi:hypothetical protein
MSKKEIMEQRKLKIEKEKEKLKFVERKMKAVSNLSETAEQELASKKFLEENATSEFIGKTNKKNLVFENSKGKRVKISPEGLLV